ncbi:MAG: GNAT family N-acetyltransferase [Chloroflexota bacterium]
MKIFEATKDDYLISTDRNKIDLPRMRDFIAETYWSKGIPLEIMQKAVDNSLTFGVYHPADGLIGCARVITDFATYHYLADVFIQDSHRGKGLGKWLMEAIMAHPDLQEFRNFNLRTGDAHGLYEKYGFETVEDPRTFMIYQKKSSYAE